MDKNEIKQIVINRYNELCAKLNGVPFNKEICVSMGGHNFTDGELFDLNYKEICITIMCDGEGKCKVCPYGVEYYNTDGEYVCSFEVK